MKLSNQALGAIMMALQKSLMEQSDIIPVLKCFNLQLNTNEELIVSNPPSVKMTEPDEEEYFHETKETTGSD